jgi:pimeloyl-ACP methyl ester carboxylesterase
MPRARVNGVTLEYELSGPREGRPLLMIHGVGAQLVRWPQGLCDRLAEAGFRLLRYDSRDVGLSTHMVDAPVPDLAEVSRDLRQGREPKLPYTLKDLAADAAGLLDAAELGPAHVLGVSLGGMVAQQLAIDHPDRVLSMAIVMSQSGNPAMPGTASQALAKLSEVAPDPRRDREGYLRHQVELNRVLGSPDYPAQEQDLRAFASLAADRAYDPAGAARQLAAGRGAADRRTALGRLDVPTVVIHGADDPLIRAACGADIAASIRRAWFLTINGMGHDLPDELHGLFVGVISANCARATPSTGAYNLAAFS